MVKIYGKYKNLKTEVIDECSKKDKDYLVNEYRLAYGKDWLIYAK